jgi:hypothetical protein
MYQGSLVYTLLVRALILSLYFIKLHPFMGDLTQSRGTECVWFGRNGSPVAAVLYVNALDRSVRASSSALPCREAKCLYIAVVLYTEGRWEGKSSLDFVRDNELLAEASN